MPSPIIMALRGVMNMVRQSARINNMYVAMFQRKVTPAPKRSAATNILARTEKPGPFDDLSVFRMSKWEQQKKQSAIEDV